MQVFGLRFTKQDHIYLIKLLYELIVTEDQEIYVINAFAGTFNALTKKKELLSPDELNLPWRPAYQLWKSVSLTKNEFYKRKFLPQSAEGMVRKFIKNCRTYFPIEATGEMLKEWKHLLCPFDMSMSDALELLDLFLPTSAPLHRHDRMYRLWFEEYMGIYENLDGSKVGWDGRFLSLFSRLAGHNIGFINWEPYLATIFSRILKAFGLPVGPASYHLSHSNPAYEFSSSCHWLVAMISPTNNCMNVIGQLVRAIEPFMHPSNNGWFQRSLHGALTKLCSIFTTRVYVERYKKQSWDNYIPDDQKLTDDQITQFVDIVKPLIFTGLFSKHGPQDMTAALYNLAFLRPERVLPQHLENLYPALENLTEPHRLKATLAGTLGVARAMMIQPDRYPEGRLHIIPILQLCLPGIDSNDCNKTMTTLQLISTMGTLISITDCSDAHLHRSDLTENESELCSQTAQLQDFIFIFIDRCFALIEGLSLDHVESAAARAKANYSEAMIETLLRSAVCSVFQQTSTSLFKPAYEKIWRYMSGKVFEVIVAGRLAAAMIYGVANARPSMVLPQVIPYCCKNILELTANKDVATDPRTDNSLLWNMLLLSEVIRPDGSELVKYVKEITLVLERTLHMTNFTAHTFACNTLERCLKSLAFIYPRDVTSISSKLNQPIAEYLPIRDWGMACNQEDLCIDWHIPDEEELKCFQAMVSKILLDELKYLDETEQYEREELTRRLRVITECIKGAGKYMPPLDSQTHTLDDEGFVPRHKFAVRGTEQAFKLKLHGENARNRILHTVRPLLMKLLDKVADSAKPLHSICTVYKLLLFHFGSDSESLEIRASTIKAVKKTLENPLKPDDGNIRYVQVQKTYVLLCRVMHAQVQFQPPTKLHVDICQDLVKLATSNYDDVQAAARSALGKFFNFFKGTQRLVMSTVCDLLITPPPNVSEEQLKGALNLVLNTEGGKPGKSMCMATRRDFVIIRSLWPAIAQAHHSEKPHIQQKVDKIIASMEKSCETIHFDFVVTDRAREAAHDLRLTCAGAEDVDLSAGHAAAQARTDKYKRLHHELLEELLELLNSDRLQWKHREFAIVMVTLLQRTDVTVSLAEVKLFSDSLIDDAVVVRKMGHAAISGILYSQKRRHERQYVSGMEFPSYESLQFNPEKAPNTEEAWNNSNFVEKTFWGCMNMPERIQVTRSCSPPSPEELSDVDRYTLDRFSDENFTSKLFQYMALETKQNDSFSSRNYTFFKCLARNYGLALVDCCKSAIDNLLTDTDHKTEKSRQRLVAEFVSGVIRGSKYWTFNQMNELFDWVLPTVRRAITNVSSEVMTHWGTAFATASEDREPRKLYRLFDFLMEEVKAVGHNIDSSTSLETSSRLYFLQGTLGQQQWRVPMLNTFVTELIKERLASPFKTIRSRLGSVLCSCYVFDLPYINNDAWHNPTRADLVTYSLPLVKDLENGTNGEEVSAESQIASENVEDVTEAMDVDASADGTLEHRDKRNKLILKTVLSWLQSNFDRHTTYQRWTSEILQFLPIVCQHTANFSDPELRTLSKNVVKHMSKTLLPPTLLPQFIQTVKEAMSLKSWNARVTVVEMLQSMMFLNQFHLHGDLRQQLQDLILDLLSDERIEVKLVAAATLSGGIQFQFFDVKGSKLLDHFKKLAATRLRSKTGSKEEKERRLHRCHTGVLGLGAIVSAYPYEVPEFIPDVLMILSDHIHDAQPIQKTVKDVLSNFKRTHLDNWLDHKQKFTDDQLVVLTDILVSPNYYA
ncbi:proteasome activator complex subunit 4B-like [Watersipora subatra]|uniref:proteasome activator complex subunit 4B-like n=1 Tax=Watersipora subatra TaxID=2589382 RepID=UPI00355C6B0A